MANDDLIRKAIPTCSHATTLSRLEKAAREATSNPRAFGITKRLEDSVAAISRANQLYTTTPAMRQAIAAQERISATVESSRLGAHMANVQARHDAMMKQISGSLTIEALASQQRLLGSFQAFDVEMATVMGALRGRATSISLTGDRIFAEMRRLQKPLGLASQYARHFGERISEVTRPWAMLGFENTSVAAALHLAQFSDRVQQMQPFSRERFALVDGEFGRFDQALPSAEAAEDEEEGEAIYTAAGRSQSLVAFPSESYEDVLAATGLTFEIRQPKFIRSDGTAIPNGVINPHDHFVINMVEGHLRELIHKVLTSAGDVAAITRLFGSKLETWKQKQMDAVKRGEPELHLIYYTDFMELADILLNRELWQNSFKPIFRNRDRLRIGLERLHGLRVPTSHTRLLTRTGRLRLWVEAEELLQAIGVLPMLNGRQVGEWANLG